jgi:hypothetical protein
MTDNIDTAGLVADMRHVIGASSYSVRVHVVDDVPDEGEQCTVCQEIGRVIAALVHYSYAEPGEEADRDCRPCCLCCIFPFIDSVPWLNIDQTITVEVSRGATRRPF